MSNSTDPLNLLEWLKQEFNVEEFVPPFGPSVIVPNGAFHPNWEQALAQIGVKVFSGVHQGRITWIIPLNPRWNNLDPQPRRGCIKGRSWTKEEDARLLEAYKLGVSIKQVARDLAPQLRLSDSDC